MKIYSWNMLYRNKEADEAFDFIAHADCDIFCLQEVPEDFLKRLQTLPYSIAFCIEVERLLPEGISKNYGVILSRYPVVNTGEIPFPDYWSQLPLRARFFVHAMPSKFFSKIRNRGAHYADLQTDQGLIRVFNLHLVQAHPEWRLQEFTTALARYDTNMLGVVCGDFNTHSMPYTALMNWILGGKISDALLYHRERARIDQMFLAHHFSNPLAGEITHDFSHSQLDHILVSSSFSIKSASVISNRHGSDHHPIRVEVG